MNKETKDFLIRGLPLDLAEKLKTAAVLHRMSMKDYLIQLFKEHLNPFVHKIFIKVVIQPDHFSGVHRWH